VSDVPLDQFTSGILEWIMTRFGLDGPMMTVHKK